MSSPSGSKASSWREAVAQFVRSRSRTSTAQRKPSVDEKSSPSASPSQRSAHLPTSGAFSAHQQKGKEEVEKEEGKSACPAAVALVMMADGAVQLFPEGTVAADVLAMHRGTLLGSLTDQQLRPDVRLRAGETYFLTPLPCCDGAGCCDCRSSCGPAGPSFDPSGDEHGLYYQQKQHQLQQQQRHLARRSSRRSMEVGVPTTDFGGTRLWPLAASSEDRAAAVGRHGHRTHCYRPLCSGPCTAAPWEVQQQQQQQVGAMGCSCRMCSPPEPSFLEGSEPAAGSPHGCVDCTSARHPGRFSSDVRSSPAGPAGVACAAPPICAAAAAMVGNGELIHSHHAPQQQLQQPLRHNQPQHHHQQQHQHHQRLQRQHSHSFTSVRQPRASIDSAAAAAHLRWSGGFPAGKPGTWHPAAGFTHCSCSAHQEQKSQQQWQQQPWPQHQFQHVLGPGGRTGHAAPGCCAASATAETVAEAESSWHVLPWTEWQRQGEARAQQRRRSLELGSMRSDFKGLERYGGVVSDRRGTAWPGASSQMPLGCMQPCSPSDVPVHGQCGEMCLGIQPQGGGQPAGGAGGQLACRNPASVSLRRSSMSLIEMQPSPRVSVSGGVRVSTPPKPPKSPEQTKAFDSLSSSESFPDLTGEAGMFPDMSGGSGPLGAQGWSPAGPNNKGMQRSPNRVSLRDRPAGKAHLLKRGSEVQRGAALACETGPLLHSVDSYPSPPACAGSKAQKPPRQQVKGTAGGAHQRTGEGTKSAGPFAPVPRQRAELRRVASASTIEVNDLDASQSEGHQTRRWVDLACDEILSGREGEEEASEPTKWSEEVEGPLTEDLIIRPGCFKVFHVGTTQPC